MASKGCSNMTLPRLQSLPVLSTLLSVAFATHTTLNVSLNSSSLLTFGLSSLTQPVTQIQPTFTFLLLQGQLFCSGTIKGNSGNRSSLASFPVLRTCPWIHQDPLLIHCPLGPALMLKGLTPSSYCFNISCAFCK